MGKPKAGGTIARMVQDGYGAECERAMAELGWTGGELGLGGVPLRRIAAEFGTPTYAFCARTLGARAATVRQALGSRVELLYSVKANPSVALTSRLRSHGIGAEIASLGELHVALAAGHPPAELRFAGPGKTAREIDRAIELGLGCFHAESEDEVETIAAAAERRATRAGVAVRVNLPSELGGSRLRMGGRSSRFGVDEEQVPALLEAIRARPALELRGLHVYAGTQCFEADSFVAHAQKIVARAQEWERDLGVTLDELDLGGGFGVQTYAGDPEFDLETAAAGIRDLIAAHDRPGRRWFIELGRYLVATCGVYLTSVVRTKDSGGERHAVIDGGMHQCAMAAGVGTVLKRTPLLAAANDPTGAPREAVTIGGPLCTSADQFAERVDLPPLAAGDLLATLRAGAYGLTYSPHGFLSHPVPAEVVVEAGAIHLARSRGDESDALRGQTPT